MTAQEQQSIAVLGPGSWGTALSVLLAKNGQPVRLWGHEPAHIAMLKSERINRTFLPDIELPELITPMDSLAKAVDGVSDIMLVVPSHVFKPVLQQLADVVSGSVRLSWATKGIVPDGCCLLHDAVNEIFGPQQVMAVLSGPTFAREVAVGLPTAATLAANDDGFAGDLSDRLHCDHFRVYTTDDIIGVEIGGAVKNVLAIATGIADGLDFGANTRAALVTRGLAEMMRLGVAIGGRRETFMGLAGLGDLVLTCTDNQSRNRRLGLALGRGEDLNSALASIAQVVEGVQTAREVMQLARRYNIDMPISTHVYKVLYQHMDVTQAVRELLSREPKAELE